MKTFKDIFAWQKSYELTLEIYKLTSNFPQAEEFGLKAQIRRAVVSIISNIAEGFKRVGKREKMQFYRIAEASLEEVKCQSMLAHDLGYLGSTNYSELSKLEDTTGKMICGWISSQKRA